MVSLKFNMNLEIDHRPYDQIIDIMDSTNQASDDDNDDFNLYSVLGDHAKNMKQAKKISQT